MDCVNCHKARQEMNKTSTKMNLNEKLVEHRNSTNQSISIKDIVWVKWKISISSFVEYFFLFLLVQKL